MTTAIVTNPHHDLHTEPRHVEQAARLNAILTALDTSGLRPALLELDPGPATVEQLRAVHQPRMVEQVRLATYQLGVWLDADTYTTDGSYDAALWSAGSAVRAVEAVLLGQVANAFALTRPPGHHATPSRSMGFCLFNNIAVAARHALSFTGIRRVAIVDYDVHHGNGTQDCFYNDPNVLVCSTHAAPLYPGTGDEHETGMGAGTGATVNVPLPYMAGDAALSLLYDEVILPALARFQPDLILVSAGYDGHWDDPLGPLSLSVNGYAALTQRIKAAAGELCGGRVVLVLEGGYNLAALSACVLASLRVLLGRDPGPDPLGPAGSREPDISNLIERLQHFHPLLKR
jgi:acetoin utilization deacetylase AcuC-like enzyme